MSRLQEPSDQQVPWQLERSPKSEAPTLQSIHDTIADRRRRHGLTMVTCTAAFLVGSVSMAFLRSRFEVNSNPVSVEAESSIASVPMQRTEADAQNALPQSQPESLPRSQPEPSSITLYANVQSIEPVFEFDTQLKKMVPVGWVQVSDSVPVELDRFSNEEIQTFQTVLKGESFHTSL